MVAIPIDIIDIIYERIEHRYERIHNSKLPPFSEIKSHYFKPESTHGKSIGVTIADYVRSKMGNESRVSISMTYHMIYQNKKKRSDYQITKLIHKKNFLQVLIFIGCENIDRFLDSIRGDVKIEVINKIETEWEEFEIVKKVSSNERDKCFFDENKFPPRGHFWCFLSDSNGIRIGKLGIYHSRRVCLSIQSKQVKEKYYGEIKPDTTNTTATIHLYRKLTKGKYETAILCFATNGYVLGGDSNCDFFMGTFAGFSSDESNPVCGTVALQTPSVYKKKDLFELYFNDFVLPKNKNISPVVFYYLSSRRMIIPKAVQNQQSQSENLYSNVINYANKFWKVYSVLGDEIHVDSCRIRSDLTVLWKSARHPRLEGKFSWINNENIESITIKNQSGSLIWHVVLENNSADEKYKVGSFMGVSNNNVLYVGNLIFEKVSKGEEDNLIPNVLRISENGTLLTRLTEIYSKRKRKYLGHEPDFLDLNLGTKKKLSQLDKGMLDYIKGTYLSIYLNHENIKPPYYKAIHINKLIIGANGDVRMYSTRFNDHNKFYEGTLRFIQGGILVINLQANSTPPISTQKIFSLANIEATFYSGVYSTYTKQGIEPICGREFLYKTEDVEFDPITLPLRSTAIENFINRNDINNDLKKILNEVLIGATDNYIKGIKNIIKRRDDYGRLYFNAACFIANKQKEKNEIMEFSNEVLYNLRQAFSHGFNDTETLKHEIVVGGLELYSKVIDIDNLSIKIG